MSDYTSSGFNSFLTRSIDDLSATNLATLASMGMNQAINYDQSQTSGSLGSVFTVGPITIDGISGAITVASSKGSEVVRIDQSGILVSDTQGPRGILGFKDNNFLIAASASGDDVTKITDDQRIFSTNFKSQRITKVISDSTSFQASVSGNTTKTYIHGFAYTPMTVGVYWEVFDVDGLIVTQHFWINGNGPSGALEGMSVNKDNILLTYNTDTRTLPGTAYWKVFTYGPNDFSPSPNTNF